MIMGSELRNEARRKQLQAQVRACSSVHWRACNYVRVFYPLRVSAGETSSHRNVEMLYQGVQELSISTLPQAFIIELPL